MQSDVWLSYENDKSGILKRDVSGTCACLHICAGVHMYVHVCTCVYNKTQANKTCMYTYMYIC